MKDGIAGLGGITMTDGELLFTDTAAAREVLADRILHRERMGLPRHGLLPTDAKAWSGAPQPTVELLCDLGVEMACDVLRTRR